MFSIWYLEHLNFSGQRKGQFDTRENMESFRSTVECRSDEATSYCYICS